MEYMFAKCSKLLNLNLSTFNMQNVKKLDNIFLLCENLENIIINNNIYQQIGHEIDKFNVTIIYPE